MVVQLSTSKGTETFPAVLRILAFQSRTIALKHHMQKVSKTLQALISNNKPRLPWYVESQAALWTPNWKLLEACTVFLPFPFHCSEPEEETVLLCSSRRKRNCFSTSRRPPFQQHQGHQEVALCDHFSPTTRGSYLDVLLLLRWMPLQKLSWL